MNNIFEPGTLVCASYKTFDGSKKPGIFFIVYDEALDASHIHTNNVLCFKCTTSHSVVGNYTVALDPEFVTFLENPTIAACSKLHTLEKKQIFKVLGKVDEITFRKVYKEYERFNQETCRQMRSEL